MIKVYKLDYIYDFENLSNKDISFAFGIIQNSKSINYNIRVKKLILTFWNNFCENLYKEIMWFTS